MHIKFAFRFFILTFFMVGLLGCSLGKKLSPVSEVFLEDVDTKKKVASLPFDHSWAWKKLPHGAYSSIYIPEIQIDKIPDEAWKDNNGTLIHSAQAYKSEVKKLAEYFHSALLEEISKLPNREFQVVNQRGPKTAVVRIVLTEVQLSRPVVHAATFLSPIPGTSALATTMNEPHVAFALRIEDSLNGELIATIADRKFPPTRIVDLNIMSVTRSVREICDFWAKMLADTFDKGHKQNIEKRGVFVLLPW